MMKYFIVITSPKGDTTATVEAGSMVEADEKAQRLARQMRNNQFTDARVKRVRRIRS